MKELSLFMNSNLMGNLIALLALVISTKTYLSAKSIDNRMSKNERLERERYVAIRQEVVDNLKQQTIVFAMQSRISKKAKEFVIEQMKRILHYGNMLPPADLNEINRCLIDSLSLLVYEAGASYQNKRFVELMEKAISVLERSKNSDEHK